MKSKNIEFQGSSGVNLAARIDMPDSEKPTATLLFAHCFTCNKNLKAVGHITRALTRQDIGVFRFDFTGLGESEGDFAESTFSTDVADLVAAAKYMKQEWIAPSIIMGHSLGGAAALQAAAQIDSTQAVCTVGSPCNPQHVEHLLSDKKEEIERKGEANVVLAGRPFKIKKKFLDDLDQQVMDGVIQNLNRALLIFHSPVDQTVSIDNAAHIYKMARHPKSFVSLDDADHLLMKEEDAVYVGEVTTAWASRYFRD